MKPTYRGGDLEQLEAVKRERDKPIGNRKKWGHGISVATSPAFPVHRPNEAQIKERERLIAAQIEKFVRQQNKTK